MTRTRVAILYGGKSVEHGVSINSARNIGQYIDTKKYEPFFIGITPQGDWYHTTTVTKEIAHGTPVSVRLSAKGCWQTANGEVLSADVVFPVLHGTDGEDGSIQGLMRVMDVPMVGTGVLGSALSMNKLTAKQMLERFQVPVVPYRVLSRVDTAPSFEEISKQVGVPFMVKAANLGSSVGVSKVKDEESYRQALADAFQYDETVLIEEFIAAREIECAILGNDPPHASLPGEIVINPKYEFYTFDAKYVDPEAVSIEVPARLTPVESERIRTLSLQAYQVLQCEDFARVDLFLARDGRVFVNEINTIPGFTNSSMYPMMWKERGISFTDLISQLIEFALARYQRNRHLQRHFQSNLTY
jgi:D-alanine-D-alanine ligase